MLIADKYWMKYYPTEKLMSHYFVLLLDKLKQKAKTDGRINEKIGKVYITYSLYTLKFLKNKMEAINLLKEVKESGVLDNYKKLSEKVDAFYLSYFCHKYQNH